MIVGKKYAPELIAANFDAIVIGSGLGGLTTAALLSKAGKKVLVLERHYTAGGFTHSFKRRGYEWDVGLHYIGDVHKPSSPIRRTFDAITDGQLKWAKMDPVYDKMIIKGQHYNYVAGTGNFKAELLKSFPHAGDQIDAYIGHVYRANKALPGYFAKRFLPEFMQSAVGSAFDKRSGNYMNRTTKEVLDDCVQDPQLASVLCGQWGDYGVPPAQSSFAMHAAVAKHYLGGASFPVGGASQIAHHIEPVIRRSGGMVLVDAPVREILVEGGRATGVRMANGDEIRSPVVISAAGVFNTYQRMLPQETRQRYQLDKLVSKVTPSVAHCCLYIGLKGNREQLQLSQSNMWVYPDYDHNKTVEKFLAKPGMDFPVIYISFPSSKDPAWDTHYPGKSTIDVITVAPYEWFKKWEDTPWKKRGKDYEAFKEKIAQRLLDEVYKQCPQVRGKVDYYELSTPLSTSHFSNYAHGELYGLEHTPDRFNQTWLRPKTPIKGLYLTGQDILTCGVVTAMFSGVMTASSLLGARMALVLPELVPGNPKLLHKLRGALWPAAPVALTPAPAPAKPLRSVLNARCVEVIKVTHDVKAFRFELADGQPLDYRPGQFVTLEVEIDGKKVFRSYTMSSTPTHQGSFEITIKRVDGGVLSNWACDKLKVGAQVRMTGPHGQFTCAPKPPKKLLFLSAGSGVTPMLSMARWLLATKKDCDVKFFHCARTPQDLIFGAEIKAMAQQSKKFTQFVSLTRAKPGSKWAGLKGHLDQAMLETVAPDFREREVFICGPEGFMDSTQALLQGLDFPMAHYHAESFDVSSGVSTEGGSVLFAESGVEVPCSGEQTILEVAEAAGVPIASACRTGDCGECKVRQIRGDVVVANRDGLGDDEVAEGYVLSCVAKVNGPVEVAV
ncbi:MAG: NAD(P)-binding protein [Rhodoferax sp.]|nr:NAD(P)-binding protein [Rhodoferax sp.]